MLVAATGPLLLMYINIIIGYIQSVARLKSNVLTVSRACSPTECQRGPTRHATDWSDTIPAKHAITRYTTSHTAKIHFIQSRI